jgi:hypothetical protein
MFQSQTLKISGTSTQTIVSVKPKTKNVTVIEKRPRYLLLMVSFIYSQFRHIFTSLTHILDIQITPLSNIVKVIDSSINAAKYYQPYMYNNCKLSQIYSFSPK